MTISAGFRTQKARIISMHRTAPDLHTRLIADRIGCTVQNVRIVARNCGLPIPHSPNGRKSITYPRRFAVAAGLLSVGS